VKKTILGKSTLGRDIEVHQLTEGKLPLLLIGGVHGDEPEGFFLVEKFEKHSPLWEGLQGLASLYLLPRLNPDGCAAFERTNGNKVDLNRNMPTKDWDPKAAKERYHPGPAPGSEIETKILIKLIENIKPVLIISAHSWEPMINYNGPAKRIAEFMSQFCGLRISDDIGYPTPGSLGTWAGWERKIPTITLEIQREQSEVDVWKTHAESLRETLLFAARGEAME
jgi:murein peptide amidase A